jgi:hypothetical protein
MKKAPLLQRGLLISAIRSPLSARLHVRCLKALAARCRRELYRLTVLKRFEPVSGDLRVMDEQILTTIVRSNEAKPLLLIEPLHNTSGHVFFSLDPPDPYSKFPLWFIRGMLRGRKVYTLT